MDQTLLRLRSEHLLLKERLQKVQSHLAKTNSKLEQLSTWFRATEMNEPLPDEAYAELKVPKQETWQAKRLLRLKLDGAIERVESEKNKLEIEIVNLRQNLDALTVCPNCHGTGTITRLMEYERLEGGQIVPKFEYVFCELCSGKGKLSL